MAKKKWEIERDSQLKMGLKPKTYKLNIKLVEAFKEACVKTGNTQANALSEFMREYCKSNGVEIEK